MMITGVDYYFETSYAPIEFRMYFNEKMKGVSDGIYPAGGLQGNGCFIELTAARFSHIGRGAHKRVLAPDLGRTPYFFIFYCFVVERSVYQSLHPIGLFPKFPKFLQ